MGIVLPCDITAQVPEDGFQDICLGAEYLIRCMIK
ncbi:predicted protein [Sclerotinia sclerotiorum 1980 UF-70]|uniref:Uncharacterized protein n=1 Tax=Sclerotinia sclerotiorum (strain ATCC 18683 / 1980 / Ss-1) TaxID=665079 RepID=A7ECE9_SCLS1|nr:predicted protein [Sclerotinia sclerotiorum 1980 UF-70]EDO00128.1 predicted protein [Sclerotinia sclerotiorum 1980 UF-70]